MSQNTITNIIRALVLLLIIALAAFAYSFYLLREATDTVIETEQNKINSYLLAYELRQSSDDLTRLARSYAATGDPEFERQYYEVLGIRNGTIPRPVGYHRIYWDLVLNPGDKPRPDGEPIKLTDMMLEAGFTEEEFNKLTESAELSNELVNLEERAMNAIKGKFEGTEKGVFNVQGEPNRDLAVGSVYGSDYAQGKATIMRPIDDFFGMMEARTEKAFQEAVTAKDLAQNIFLGTALATLALVALLGFFSSKRGRLQLAERAAAQEKAEAENEQLNNSVISILQTMNQLADRDLTAKAPVTEDIIGTISDSVNALTDETARVLRDVNDVATQVGNVSIKVKSQADMVSLTSEEERARVAEMNTTLQQATQTMNQMATLAQNSNTSAAQASQATDDALTQVNQTVNDMDSIRETIAQTEKRIKRLGERSQEISGIVDLINTISERTHVLALNASMQAAVAGDAGRGFAVVADEVQHLAENSKAATEQIETLVKNIQLDTNETINTVNQTIDQVVKGSEQAKRAGQQMHLNKDITEQLVAQVQQIAKSAEAQKQMSGQLVTSVQRMGQSNKQTADRIEEQNRETDQLLDASKRLIDSVSVFTLPDEADEDVVTQDAA